ncbi:ABC transporter substrate-binding protein [Ovoidimarina sediminis]|uniref:ABC transporter substrate-binding protein n=1 Tax=Ovoidimarina sediminis TaxID=3079856 RepID=UPI002906B94D|nr:ABC transporter substrate-binding protein [Rhodophyticola sp. MJ-SS7]MDU8944965.1 ABC transporter substrate-binding protein [Rhodophyticola sp. MJ-SS7]
MTLNRRQSMGLMAAAMAAPALPAYANTKLKVGALRFTSHAASFVAYERGYFAEEGLDVEFEFFQAAQPMAVAIASGDADFAVTAISGGLISLAEKGAAKVIGGALSEEKGIDGQMILASNAAHEAGLTSPAGLDGKKFGVTQAGSSFHYMGAKIAAAEGVTPEFVPLQKVPAVIGALKSGQIDAWTIVPHIAKPLAGSGAVQAIGMVADYLPDYQVTTVFTSTTNAAEERAKTEAFLRAFSRGADDFNAALVDKTAGDDALEEMVKLIHLYVYTDREYEKAKPSIVNGAMRINANAALNMASVQDQVDWFKAEGLVKDSVTTEMLVDASYVEVIS